MNGMNKISDAGVYTDFNELARLRADAKQTSGAAQSNGASNETTKKVAKQIEAVFFQMVLKSMREANLPGDSNESDQTRFYQDMFDKQISLELAGKDKGVGLAAELERVITGKQGGNFEAAPVTDNFELIQNQVKRSTSSIHKQQYGKQE